MHFHFWLQWAVFLTYREHLLISNCSRTKWTILGLKKTSWWREMQVSYIFLFKCNKVHLSLTNWPTDNGEEVKNEIINLRKAHLLNQKFTKSYNIIFFNGVKFEDAQSYLYMEFDRNPIKWGVRLVFHSYNSICSNI